MNWLKKIWVSIMVIVVLATLVSYGQGGIESDNEDLSVLVSRIMAKCRENKEAMPLTDERIKRESPEKLLSLLRLYEEDSFLVKQRALYYEVKIAKLHPMSEVTQSVTANLVRHMLEPNSQIRGDCYRWLKGFSAKDFDDESKRFVAQAIENGKERSTFREVLIAGIADIKEVLPILEKLLIDEVAFKKDPNRKSENWYHQIGWYARLARARMSVKQDIDRCIEMTRLELSEKPYRLKLLHDMGYIRQPEAIEFLKTYLFSDETIGQVKPTAPGEPVASYVINILADCLNNFPIKKRDERGYKKEEIELCKEWMSQQTQWEIVR